MNNKNQITKEEALLLGLCRLEFTAEQISDIRKTIKEVADWDQFRILVNDHGIAALIFHNLEKNKLTCFVPEAVRAFLHGAMMRSLSRNTFNTESTVEVLRLLNAHNIKTVILKGLALETTVYGNEGLRQMSDVDLLIASEECIRARNILLNNGYVSSPVKSVLHKPILAKIGKHLPTLIKNGVFTEIHHELFGRKSHALTSMLYDTSYSIDFKGEKAYIPQPQIFFLYLVRHLGTHEMSNESQLRLYTDLVVLTEKYKEEIINCDLLIYAIQAGMSEVLADHLEPLRDWWGIRFPEWVNKFIDRQHSPGSADRFIFFLRNPKNNPPLNRAKFYRQIISEIPGIHRKILFLLGDIIPSFSFMKRRYKSSNSLSVLMHYPLRFGKILWLFRK